jgi:hypothetical protein
MTEQTFLCPVCEYAGLHEPPYDESGWGSFEICPQCGTEFGYDLVNSAIFAGGFGAVCGLKTKQEELDSLHAQLRQRWIDGGRDWWSKARSTARSE